MHESKRACWQMASFECARAQNATFDQEPDFGDADEAAPFEEADPYTYSDPDPSGYPAQSPPAGEPTGFPLLGGCLGAANLQNIKSQV